MILAARLSGHSAQVCCLPKVVCTVARGDRQTQSLLTMSTALWKLLRRGRSVGVAEGGRGKQRINSRLLVVSTGVVSRRRRGETLELVLK